MAIVAVWSTIRLSMSTLSNLFTDLDFDRDGKHFGYIQAPQSTNTAGWANLFIPLVIIKRGHGPTALLFGGNHGDEYEGPVTLLKLARDIRPDRVRGRIILVPALNLPAVQANTRLSPLDGRNMNRAFPGSPSDTITGQIAHFVASYYRHTICQIALCHRAGTARKFANRYSDLAQGKQRPQYDR